MAVTLTITGDTSSAESALKQLQHAFNETTKAAEFLREVGSKIAAAFTIGAIVEFTREAINAAENIKILKEQTGLSIETLAGLKEAADKTREGFGGMSLALTHFSQALGVALRQGGGSAQAFRDLIGVEGLAGVASGARSMDQVLIEVAHRLNDLPNAMQKAQLANEMFGRSWRDVLPAIAEVKDELEQGAITPAMVEDASQFNRTLREMKDELEKIFIGLARELVPTLRELLTLVKQLSGEFGGTQKVLEAIGVAAKLGVFGFEAFGIAAAECAATIIDGFKTAKKVIEDLVYTAVKGAQVIGGAGAGNLRGALKAYAEFSRSKGEAGIDAMGFLKRSAERGNETDARILAAALRLFGPTNQFSAAAAAAISGGETATGTSTFSAAPAARIAPSIEAENLIRDIDKAFKESVEGKKALLEQEQKDLTDKAEKEILDKSKLEEEKTKIQQIYSRKRMDLEQQEADTRREIELSGVQAQRQLLQSDPFQSQNAKKAELIGLLAKENQLLTANVAITERRLNDETLNPELHLAAEKQLQDLQQKLAENQRDTITTVASGTLGGEFKRQLTELKDQFGTVATQIAKTWKDVIGTAISSVSNAITGLITGTQTWSQALRQIGTSVLNVVIQGLVNMFAAMVLGENEVAAAKLAKQAATIPGELVGALATAIGEGGWAAAAIIAAAVAALGVGVAYAAGAFAEGGRPPVGEFSIVGEKGRELFVPDQPGTILPNNMTEKILSGDIASNHRNGSITSNHRNGVSEFQGLNGRGVDLRLFVVPDKQSIPSWARSRDFEDHVLDIPS